jgi:DNA invertase Pin-like site-specific DNA recombinase
VPEAVRGITIRQAGLNAGAVKDTPCRVDRHGAGLEAARAENGGRCPWGGRKPGTRVKVTKEVERVIRERMAAGESIASIARVCGLSRVTVYSVLKHAPLASREVS